MGNCTEYHRPRIRLLTWNMVGDQHVSILAFSDVFGKPADSFLRCCSFCPSQRLTD